MATKITKAEPEAFDLDAAIASARADRDGKQARVRDLRSLTDPNANVTRPTVSREEFWRASADRPQAELELAEAEIALAALERQRDTRRDQQIEAATVAKDAAIRPLLAQLDAVIATAVPLAEQVAAHEQAWHDATGRYLDPASFTPLLRPNAISESMVDHWRASLIARGLLDE
jgi:hypothetical protein